MASRFSLVRVERNRGNSESLLKMLDIGYKIISSVGVGGIRYCDQYTEYLLEKKVEVNDEL